MRSPAGRRTGQRRPPAGQGQAAGAGQRRPPFRPGTGRCRAGLRCWPVARRTEAPAETHPNSMPTKGTARAVLLGLVGIRDQDRAVQVAAVDRDGWDIRTSSAPSTHSRPLTIARPPAGQEGAWFQASAGRLQAELQASGRPILSWICVRPALSARLAHDVNCLACGPSNEVADRNTHKIKSPEWCIGPVRTLFSMIEEECGPLSRARRSKIDPRSCCSNPAGHEQAGRTDHKCANGT